ncbi:MAG TPA: phosphoribosylglycinamide formyltransferase [Clostridiales bacterium]|nr:phosphoribosylglycinamide formyltransferase [Clostridiales bacterium]
MLSKIKIAVFVSGGGTNLQALIDAEKRGEIKSGTIALVLSDKPTAYALERAKAAGIPTAVLERKAFSTQTEYEDAVANLVTEREIGLIVLAGFMRILGENFTKKFENRIINVHPSLIPSFCGKGYYGLIVHEKALEYGVKVTGATVHYVNEIADGGKIIMQKAVNVLPGDTPEVLQKRVMQEAEWIILPQATEYVCNQLLNSQK